MRLAFGVTLISCLVGACTGGESSGLAMCPSYLGPPPAIGDPCSGTWSCDYHNANYCNGGFACVGGRVSGRCDRPDASPVDEAPGDASPADVVSHDSGPTLCAQMQGQCIGTSMSSFGCTVRCPIGMILAGSMGQTETTGPCFVTDPRPGPYGCPVSSNAFTACCVPAPDGGDGGEPDAGDADEPDAGEFDGGE